AQTDETHQVDSESNSGTAGTSGQNYLFGSAHGGSDAGQGLSIGTNGISNYEHGAGYMPATAVYQGQFIDPRIIDIFYTDRRPTLYVDGQLVRTGLTSGRALVSSTRQIGAGTYGEFKGLVPEVIIFPDTLSNEDRQKLECNISEYFSIDLTIPGFQIYTENDPAPPGCLIAEEEVVWNETSLVNMYSSGMSLQKVSGGNNWNAGASSLNKIYDNGYIKFVATAENMRRMIGLSTTDSDANYTSIEYAIYLRNDGNLFIYENGNNRGGFGTYSLGDTILIRVEAGVVRYYHNESLLYISSTSPTLPLIADVSARYEGSVVDFIRVGNITDGSFSANLYNGGTGPSYQWKLNNADVGTGLPDYSNTSLSPGDELWCEVIPGNSSCGLPYVSNKVIITELPDSKSFGFYISGVPAASACSHSLEDVVWNISSEENVNTSYNSIIKSQGGSGSFNAGASSLNSVFDNGYLEFIASETNYSRMIGLSDVDENTNYTSIDFAFYLRSNSVLYVYENGSNRFTIGSYSTGDTLRIHIKEGVVHYYQNGELKYLSGSTPVLPMIADVSMYHQGASISDVKLANYSTGTFSANVNDAGSNPVYQWILNGTNVGTNSSNYTNTGLI
ncbi:MAG: hypothetical protein ACP5E3_06500, partial [Bacteroidales bacterium]